MIFVVCIADGINSKAIFIITEGFNGCSANIRNISTIINSSIMSIHTYSSKITGDWDSDFDFVYDRIIISRDG